MLNFKRIILAVVFVVCCAISLIIVSTGEAAQANNNSPQITKKQAKKPIAHMSGAQVASFIEKVWHKKRWQKNVPNKKVFTAYQKMLLSHPQRSTTIKSKWRQAKKIYYQHKKKMTWWHKITPFKGGGKRWSIPYYIVVCESGARLFSSSAPSGAYGLLESTWRQFRSSKANQYSMPYLAPKIEQDRVAHILWTRYGGSPWTCS